MDNFLIPKNEELNALQLMSKAALNSKFYNNLGGEAGILSIMLLARELNIPPMQALSGGIWNIQGKVEMSARMMNMKIRQAGHKLKVTMADTSCEVVGERKDTGETFTATFTLKDAERAGCLNKTVWKQYPREMFFARALSLCARVLFPDVIGNCYVEGEIDVTPVKNLSNQFVEKTVEVSPAKSKEVIAEKVYITEEQYEELLSYVTDREDLIKWLDERKGQITIEIYNQFKEKFA